MQWRALTASFLAWGMLYCLTAVLGDAWVVVLAQGAGVALPEGKGVEKVKQSCGICHGIEVVAQQRLDRTEWTRVVDQMIEFGAALRPDDRRDIVDYLASFLGPDKREN